MFGSGKDERVKISCDQDDDKLVCKVLVDDEEVATLQLAVDGDEKRLLDIDIKDVGKFRKVMGLFNLKDLKLR